MPQGTPRAIGANFGGSSRASTDRHAERALLPSLSSWRESCELVSIRKTVRCSASDPPVKCQSRDWHQEREHPDILHRAGSKKANGKQHVMSRRARSGGTKQESGSGPADPRDPEALTAMGTVQGSKGSPHPAPGPCPAAVLRLQRGTTVTGRSRGSRVPVLAGTGSCPGRCPAGPTQHPSRQAAGSGPGRDAQAGETGRQRVQVPLWSPLARGGAVGGGR